MQKQPTPAVFGTKCLLTKRLGAPARSVIILEGILLSWMLDVSQQKPVGLAKVM